MFLVTNGNLRPLLNGESLKNWRNGEFENRMSQIWSIFKHMFENRSIFTQMFENTVHFPTHFEKIPLAPPPAAPSGRRRARRRGYFFKIFGKQTPFFPNYFENRPIHIFLIDTFLCFQITIIYRGTQVTIFLV